MILFFYFMLQIASNAHSTSSPIRGKNTTDSFLYPYKADYKDTYISFSEMAQHHLAGTDYKIIIKNQHPTHTVLAIHGGHIETGTSEIAQALASNNFNLYLFEGLKKESWNLHITSTHYDEPMALNLVGRSNSCISIHGFKNSSASEVCLGGLDTELLKKVYTELNKTGLIQQNEVNPCRKFYAISRSNIVNRCLNHGVQIEMSAQLRKRLVENKNEMDLFVEAIKKAWLYERSP